MTDEITLEEVRNAANAYQFGAEFAHRHVAAKDEPFMAAFQIADRLGYERKTLNWKCAVSGAWAALQEYTIVLDEKGMIQ